MRRRYNDTYAGDPLSIIQREARPSRSESPAGAQQKRILRMILFPLGTAPTKVLAAGVGGLLGTPELPGLGTAGGAMMGLAAAEVADRLTQEGDDRPRKNGRRVKRRKFRRGPATRANYGGSKVQTLLFERGRFTVERAKAWARKHGFRDNSVDVTADYIRLRQAAPSRFIRSTFGTIVFGRKKGARGKKASNTGIKAVVAVPR